MSRTSLFTIATLLLAQSVFGNTKRVPISSLEVGISRVVWKEEVFLVTRISEANLTLFNETTREVKTIRSKRRIHATTPKQSCGSVFLTADSIPSQTCSYTHINYTFPELLKDHTRKVTVIGTAEEQLANINNLPADGKVNCYETETILPVFPAKMFSHYSARVLGTRTTGYEIDDSGTKIRCVPIRNRSNVIVGFDCL